MREIVIKADCLNSQCHQSSGKKESKTVFKAKWELKFRRSIISLKVSEFMEQNHHQKFIEKHN